MTQSAAAFVSAEYDAGHFVNLDVGVAQRHKLADTAAGRLAANARSQLAGCTDEGNFHGPLYPRGNCFAGQVSADSASIQLSSQSMTKVNEVPAPLPTTSGRFLTSKSRKHGALVTNPSSRRVGSEPLVLGPV